MTVIFVRVKHVTRNKKKKKPPCVRHTGSTKGSKATRFNPYNQYSL